MDQAALDRRLGTVGANPPCCFRTATHLVTHSSKIWPETPATSRFNRHSPDKGGRLRSLLFFTLQPHRPKTRHQKWPSETESRNDAFVARSGTRRLSLIRRVGPICADFGGPPANNGGDRTGWLGWEDSNSEMSSQNIPLKGRTDFRGSYIRCSNFVRIAAISSLSFRRHFLSRARTSSVVGSSPDSMR